MTRRRTLWLVLVTAAAVALVFVYGAYEHDLAAARERVGTGSQLVQTPCGPIEYAAMGQGPPLLLVHGAGGGYDQGLELGQALADSGFHVVAMSRFGYLGTPLPADASAPAQADAHGCLLDYLRISRAAVLGVSAGAPSALQFALRHPQRTSALVLLVPAAYMPRPSGSLSSRAPAATQFLLDTALQSDFLFWAALKIGRRTLTHALLATPSGVVDSAPEEERTRVARLLDHLLPVTSRRLGLVNDAAVTSSLPRYELERIAAPTLVLSVADDLFGTYDSARYTAEHIPAARFIGYASGGHVWVGHQRDVMGEILAFLTPREASDGAASP